MLTQHEIEVLRHIREGRDPEHADHTSAVIDKGYATRTDGKLMLTEHGESQLRLLPGYGEALVDILIPGAGSEQAVDAAVAAEAKRPHDADEKNR